MQEQLAKLIEMYAAARSANNSDLVALAAQQLNEFLSKVVITELPPARPPAPPTEEAQTED
jgi:hypothetical protein